MAMYVFDCVHVWGAEGFYVVQNVHMGRKSGDEATPQKNNSGTPNAQRREKKDTKSPDEVCRTDFSSSSMLTGQVAGWCVGRE
jgi:hypothetical protein